MASAKRRADWIDALNVSLMFGLMGMGVIAYLVLPLLTTTVELPLFSPHAYNLLLWPSMALLVLRKRFSPIYVLPMLVFVYALDELLWNGLAVAYYWGQWKVLTYVFLPDWHLFIGVLVAAGAVCYLIARPSVSFSVMWPVLGCFAVFWAWVAGFPVLAATNVLTLGFQQTLYRMVWEVMWQVVFWGFVYGSVNARRTAVELLIQRPSVG